MGDVDRDGRNGLFAYGKSGSFLYRGTGVVAAPFAPRESSSVHPATTTPRHPIVCHVWPAGRDCRRTAGRSWTRQGLPTRLSARLSAP
ncbi:hypothetical protein [Streptomyces sp. NPDC012508]|uniref:hypothetical protein n=1 Tax=Streptomyces sp. NPDC012508 TaxID=3364837 RepID=UPI0036D1C73C